MLDMLNAYIETSVALVRAMRYKRCVVMHLSTTHGDVEKHCDLLQSEHDCGISMMGFEVRWTIGRKPA